MPVTALKGPQSLMRLMFHVILLSSFAFTSLDINLSNRRKFSLSTIVGSASEHSLFCISAAR